MLGSYTVQDKSALPKQNKLTLYSVEVKQSLYRPIIGPGGSRRLRQTIGT